MTSWQPLTQSSLASNPILFIFVISTSISIHKGYSSCRFKVAVAVPNLDELLGSTPTHVFASVWYEWQKTKYYPLHYSELVRLAALYK
jgi:hypothetical protein